MSISLADLIQEIAAVRLSCRRCGHTVDVSGLDMLLRFGPRFPLREIGGRCRCTTCGSRDVESRPAYSGQPQGMVSRGVDGVGPH